MNSAQNEDLNDRAAEVPEVDNWLTQALTASSYYLGGGQVE